MRYLQTCWCSGWPKVAWLLVSQRSWSHEIPRTPWWVRWQSSSCALSARATCKSAVYTVSPNHSAPHLFCLVARKYMLILSALLQIWMCTCLYVHAKCTYLKQIGNITLIKGKDSMKMFQSLNFTKHISLISFDEHHYLTIGVLAGSYSLGTNPGYSRHPFDQSEPLASWPLEPGR